MKTHLTYLILALLVIGCNNREKVALEYNSFEHHPCDDCPEISITLPTALDRSKIALTINSSLEEEVISLLTFDDSVEVSTIDEAITSFTMGYRELKALYPDESPGWNAEIFAKVTYEDRYMITLELNSYIFTGGAHGYGSTRYLNFNKRKGKELEDWELFGNRIAFQRFAEARFRKQEDIPKDQPINSTGFMFEKDTFYLPENIGFTKRGIKLLYNQYEVASYADGPIELILPYKEVRKYLNKEIKS